MLHIIHIRNLVFKSASVLSFQNSKFTIKGIKLLHLHNKIHTIFFGRAIYHKVEGKFIYYYWKWREGGFKHVYTEQTKYLPTYHFHISKLKEGPNLTHNDLWILKEILIWINQAIWFLDIGNYFSGMALKLLN